MLRAIVIAVGVGLALANGLAHAQGTGSVRVQVNGHREVHGSNPNAALGKAEVKNLATGKSETVDLSASGRADVGELADGAYQVTVTSGDRIGTTYVTVAGGRASTAGITAGGLPTAATFGSSADSLLAAVRAAIAACDRAAYDRAVTELDRDVSMLEVNLRDLGRAIDEYGRLTDRQPDVRQLRAALNATGSLRRAGAAADPGIRHIPAYIGALEEKARLEARLNALRAARAQVPPFPQPCGETAASRFAQQVALQFLFAPEITLVLANRPQFAPFRLEVGGILTKLGAYKPDDTDTGTKIGMSGSVRWDSSLLGTKQIGIEAKLWYVDYDFEDSGEVTADPGGTIGLFSPSTSGNPFGGYFTAGPLTNGQYNSEVRSYGGEVQIQTWISSGNFRAMPWIGVRVGRTTVNEDMRFDIGMPAFTTFEQHNDIKDTYVGPTVGLKARLDIGGGLYGFTEGSVGLEYHRGKGDWSTFVPAVDMEPRKDNLSSSKWGITAGIKAGLGWDIGRSLNVQIGIGVSYTNASPYIEFEEDDSTTTGTGGAGIGYGTQREVFGEFRFGMKF